MVDQKAEIERRLNFVDPRAKVLADRIAQYEHEFKNDDGTNTTAYYLAHEELSKIPSNRSPQLLQEALKAGVDLRPYYGTTYADAVKFKQDLGQYAGKDQSMIIPANPVGYGGQFQFDPNFGSTFYRDLAMKSGEALGLTEEQILKKGTEYFADKFASGASTKGVIGFTDFGTGLLDEFAKTAGYPAAQVNDLRTTTLKPLYDVNQQLFTGLNGAARVESQSSGFFKGLAQDIVKNPLLAAGALALSGGTLAPALLSGTSLAGSAIATGAIAGGTMGAIKGIADGNFSSILKNGFKGALQGAATGAVSKIAQGVDGAVSKGLVRAGMDPGRLVNGISGAASGATAGALGAALTGQDVGNSLLKAAVIGGFGGAARAPTAPNTDIGDGIDNSNRDLGKSMDAYSLLQQPQNLQTAVRAALPQIGKQAISKVFGEKPNAAQRFGSDSVVDTADEETPADPYRVGGLISTNAYTRDPQTATREAAKFDLQKLAGKNNFKPGLISGGIYGG